ncbi:MAG: hypothetical protein GXY52_05180 [Chloroflexi bacterium]|nr:hypothetical protein [Chloroflexota bacterium]
MSQRRDATNRLLPDDQSAQQRRRVKLARLAGAALGQMGAARMSDTMLEPIARAILSLLPEQQGG